MGGEHEECNLKGVRSVSFFKIVGDPFYGPFVSSLLLEYMCFPIFLVPSSSYMHMTVLGSLLTYQNEHGKLVHPLFIDVAHHQKMLLPDSLVYLNTRVRHLVNIFINTQTSFRVKIIVKF